MKEDIYNLLVQNGYLIQETRGQLLIRKKLMTGWREFLYLFVPGLILFLLVTWLKIFESPFLLIFGLSVSVVFMVIPFFGYFTAAYRSLLIDFDSQSLLFRSAVSRAYRLFEITDINLEISSESEGKLISKQMRKQRYTIMILFINGAKEELLSIIFDDDGDESVIFKLKGYFQILLAKRTEN